MSVALQTYQGLGGRVGLGSIGRAALLPSLLTEIREEVEHNTLPTKLTHSSGEASQDHLKPLPAKPLDNLLASIKFYLTRFYP